MIKTIKYSIVTDRVISQKRRPYIRDIYTNLIKGRLFCQMTLSVTMQHLLVINTYKRLETVLNYYKKSQ